MKDWLNQIRGRVEAWMRPDRRGGISAPDLARLLRRDQVLGKGLLWGAAAVLGLVMLAEVWPGWLESWTSFLFVGLFGVWMLMNLHGTRVAAELPMINAALENNLPGAEARITVGMRRWPLPRTVRLLLGHRLAVVRLRQGRHFEAAALCQVMLAEPMGPAEHLRPELLLIFAEARLDSGDPMGTYSALVELSHRRLNLVQLLQKVAMETRYLVGLGLDAAVLERVQQRLELASLMPVFQGGVVHALLAVAARRQGRTELADWLKERAELICGPRELAMIWGGKRIDLRG
ncbi:MAG: hypothetical protein IT443_12145 [Phycisphaeraceae bacterium]|nr:hypothetical protein [Phycisphaeraceae bacterium]